MLPGCAAKSRVTASGETRQSDSVFVREAIRDTVVTVPADSSMVRALLECDSSGQIRVREVEEYRSGTRLPPPRLKIREAAAAGRRACVVTASAEIDSMNIYLALKDRYQATTKAEREVVIKTVEVNRLTRWQTLWMRFGQVLTAAVVAVGGYVIVKLVKRK